MKIGEVKWQHQWEAQKKNNISWLDQSQLNFTRNNLMSNSARMAKYYLL